MLHNHDIEMKDTEKCERFLVNISVYSVFMPPNLWLKATSSS